jgi:hypothetical protein
MATMASPVLQAAPGLRFRKPPRQFPLAPMSLFTREFIRKKVNVEVSGSAGAGLITF